MEHIRSNLIKSILFIIAALSLSMPYPTSAFELTPTAQSTGEQPSERRVPEDSNKVVNSAGPNSLVVQDLTSGLTPEQLTNLLVGSGITVSNIKYQGSVLSAGQFSNGLDIVGFGEGIILSSGGVLGTVGPNQSDSYSVDLGLPGDADLTELAGYVTYDATVLEFDFVPDLDQVSFQFTFSSEEYNEFVNTVFNDVFAFYINGQNCALIDGDPISINTINNGNPYGIPPNSHPLFYLNNDLSDGGGSYNTEMDGLTFVLTCSSPVIPNQTNHMKLAIADASDHIYDSAVFLRAGSITTERLPVILVPGMSASFNATCFWDELFCDNDQLWGWFPVLAEPFYSPLIERLKAAGYTEENHFLSIFHYDWRKPIEENVGRLIEHLDMIKEETDKDQVDLVGHSMGGLLSRAYVQSDQYEGREDVAHVVTLGSPHQGAAKAYPYWQAASMYEMGTLESIASNILLLHYMKQEFNPIPVLVLRERIPSFKDILPVYGYLYNNDTNELIPESTLHHRNSFLTLLNESISTFYDRTEVATFVGGALNTTARFYVDDWTIWNGFNWVDGKPNWDRQSEFYSQNGDGTVLSESGKLDEAFVIEFPSIDHGSLPGDNNVINAVFAYLGITVAPVPTPSIIPSIMALIVDGAAQVKITDPLGQTLQPPEQGGPSSSQTVAGTIPGAVYITVPGDPYQVILIPDPITGDYQIDVKGISEGNFTLGRLDTFTDTLDIPQPAEAYWDLSNSQIQPATTLTYSVSFSDTAQTISDLNAITPLIEWPVWVNDRTVSGRGQPGTEVIIHDAAGGTVLGFGQVNDDGHYTANLVEPLKAKQRIYPTSAELIGSIVTVGSYDIYLPISVR